MQAGVDSTRADLPEHATLVEKRCRCAAWSAPAVLLATVYGVTGPEASDFLFVG